MRNLSILLLIIPLFQLGAQINEGKKLNKHDLLIKISPLSIFDPTFPKVEYGASFILDDKIGLQLKFAQKVDILNMDDINCYDGFKFSMEYQYLFSRKMYVSIENGISRNKVSDKMSYYVSSSNKTIIVDSYQALSEKVFMVFKYGYILYYSDYLIIDCFGGIGPEYHQRTIDDLEYDPASGNINTIDFYEWFRPKFEERREPNIRFSFGLNINWRIKRIK